MFPYPGPDAGGAAVPARFRARPLMPSRFGLVMAIVVVIALLNGASAVDPIIAGLVWAAMAALVFAGWLWPLLAIRLVSVRVIDAPTDLAVGRSATVRIRVSSRGLLNHLRLGVGDDDRLQNSPLDGEGEVDVRVERRGVFDHLQVVIVSDAPLGMLTASRRCRVALPRPWFVGPAVGDVPAAPSTVPDTGDDPSSRPSAAGGDVVRSVRPYRSGDPAHLVHWPSSARSGTIVVRELEPPVRTGLVLVVEIDDFSERAEAAVARAAGIGRSVLAAEGALVVCTCGRLGPVTAPVGSLLHLQRRLADVVPGPAGTPPDGRGAGWPTERVVP